ncbi:MAG: metallophosphoesterase family protein [Planctomycetota bacterium]|jgi:exonuclease SbcD
MGLRFVHLADTHLGARHPGRASGDPFLQNMRRALAPARDGAADLVFHAGDLFNRSRPPVRVVAEGSHSILEAAEGGAHVFVVAGNHERSVLPCRLLLTHPRVHFLESAGCLSIRVGGLDLSVFGFPFARRRVRERFGALLRATGWPRDRADVNVLLCHQTFEGATVGPADFTFRAGPDVIPPAWIPPDLDYAALGHIHRHQHLSHPRTDRLVLSYPGATERTSRAERFEEKGCIHGVLEPGERTRVRFRVLPTEPVSAPRREPARS